jgi:hypothetical protein
VRWFVPKIIKNGLCSSFSYWSFIWACFADKSHRAKRWQITRLHQVPSNPYGVQFFLRWLRLYIAPFEFKVRKRSESRHAPLKLSLNLKTGIITISHQFRDKAARYRYKFSTFNKSISIHREVPGGDSCNMPTFWSQTCEHMQNALPIS